MFLVPFNKKRILDSTLSSQQQQHQSKQSQQSGDNQFIPSTEAHRKPADYLQLALRNSHQHHHHHHQQSNNKWLTQLHRTLVHFIIGASSLAKRIFIDSLSSFRRCLHISIQTLLALSNSFASQCTSEPLELQNTSVEADDPYQCDTTRMDCCRRRITQRAASNELHRTAVGPSANTEACYLDYQPPFSSASNAQTCTSVGPQVPGENKATECRQLRREHSGPTFQGHRQQRSRGLQTEVEECRREWPQQQQQQQQQIILLHQHRLQRSQPDTQAPKNLKHPAHVTQSSSSTSSSGAADCESAHHNQHHQYQEHEGQGTCNVPMNFSARSKQSREQEQQQYHYQKHIAKAKQDALAEVAQAPNGASMVLVSKETISNLTDQIALSMSKMKDLEDQVKVIPELQRRLESVISDSNSSSVSDSNHYFTPNGSNTTRYDFSHSNSNHHRHHLPAGMQDSSFSTDNMIPFYHNEAHRLGSANKIPNNNDGFKTIYPSLQRHYNSFRHATNNNTRNASSFSVRDSTPAARATAGNLNLRSPITGSHDLHYNRGDDGYYNNHTINTSRQSLPVSPSTTNLNRSNRDINENRSSSPKVEYEDLINDLISLSYSVNYPSSNTSLLHAQTNNVKRSNSQVKDNRTQNKVAEQEQQQSIKRSSPSIAKLDCGCQSFKEHLRYNSISREQRMQHARSHSASYTSAVSNALSSSSPSTPLRTSSKRDASTSTDLLMGEIVTRVELNSLISSMQKTYSTLSSITSREDETTPVQLNKVNQNSSSGASDGRSDSSSGPKSSSPLNSRSDTCDDDDDDQIKGSVDENDNPRMRVSDDDDDEEEEEEEEEETNTRGNTGSLNGEGPFSLGSSYQDPSDFEEYCAYGESLDRRTKDFMSQSTKIPNDLRFALIRLNDFIKQNRSYEQIESSYGCIEVIRKEWFDVAASKHSQPAKVKLYVDYFESFNKQLLNTVVNLYDNAGNSAMHYAASLYKLDIIKILLDTKVCDLNRRNKAGYTPIMLLALTDIVSQEDQEIAKHLFSMGDVNVKSRISGQTAIMLAASNGRASTCKLLLDSGADPSLQDYEGSTALMCGSEIGNEEVVRCLLAHKLTDPNSVDNDGLDALTIAMNNGHKNIGLILYAAKNIPRMLRPAMNDPARQINSLNRQVNSSKYSGRYLGTS